MNIEEMARKISELELRFESLKDATALFQDNITNNIYWFYSVLGIIVALIGAVGVALYFLVKTSVTKGIESGIKSVESSVSKEIATFNEGITQLETGIQQDKTSFEQRVIQLIENNLKIRWASGELFSFNNQYASVHGLNGTIDWKSPITNVRILHSDSNQEIPFEFLEQRENSFAFRINTIEDYKRIKWIIVWSEK